MKAGWFMGVSVAVLLAWYAARGVQRENLELRHFSRAEFGAYWPLLSIELLKKVDEFRARLGYPVMISPAPGAIGRPIIGEDGSMGEDASEAERTQHNYLIHGEIRALDVMPVPPGGATPAEMQRWFNIAKDVGFTGVGIYPHWRPRAGMHIDVRRDRKPGDPAKWGGVRNADGKQVLVSIDKAMVA